MEISHGNTLENSGKQNPKMGFKSPPEHIVRIHSAFKWLKCKHLRHNSFYVKKNVIHRIVLTFCDAPFSLFRGTCYRAANWSWLGQTQGRGRNDRSRLTRVPIKDIYVRALCKDFRQRLTQSSQRCS
jgi:hypothetical protein